MSIEFYCSHCQSVLRVPDEIVGRKAQCPYCNEIQIVPLSSVSSNHDPHGGETDGTPSKEPQSIPSGAIPLAPAYHSSDFNPFSASEPQFGTVPLPLQNLPPIRGEFGELFQRTWGLFCSRFGDFLLVGLIISGIMFFFYMLDGLLKNSLNNLIGRNEWYIFLVSCIFCLNLLTSVMQTYLFVGGVRYAIYLARGGASQISLMFPNFLPVFYYLISTFIIGLIMLIPAALFIIIGAGGLIFLGLPLAQQEVVHVVSNAVH